MGRFDTRMRRAPVRIGATMARQAQRQLLNEADRTALGAGGYGQKELPNAPVPLELRLDKGAGPNTPGQIATTVPLGRTRRKKGYPPITLAGGS
jgi:hypothetical protein